MLRLVRPPLTTLKTAFSKPAHNIQFDELIIHRRARTKLHSIADFFPNLIEGVGGRQAVAGALWIFATGSETAAAV